MFGRKPASPQLHTQPKRGIETKHIQNYTADFIKSASNECGL